MQLSFSEQCCDAVDYLALGARCAATLECYDPLRPVGAALWFALPHALGLPAETLILLHGALALASCVLASRLLLRWLAPTLDSLGFALARVLRALTVGAICLVHLVYLWPTMFNALADPPAALLMLIGLWALLLRPRHVAAYVGIGLLFGAAAWIRAFYLYPLIGFFLVTALLWAFDRRRRFAETGLIAFLLPILVQVAVNWQHTGRLGFIDSDQRQTWGELHLRDGAMGYDTLLPTETFRWKTTCSADAAGPMLALERRDPGLAACLVANRGYFYFGSFAPATYLKHDDLDLHYFADAEILSTSLVAATMQFNAATAPDGRDNVIRLGPSTRNGTTPFGVDMRFRPEFDAQYVFSVWAWSPDAGQIETRIDVPDAAHLPASVASAALTPIPERRHMSAILEAGREYRLWIGTGNTDSASTVKPVSTLYLWGGKLEQGATPVPWRSRADPRLGEAQRLWSPWLAASHAVALLWLAALGWNRWPPSRVGLGITLLLGVILAQALVIVPEQRFAVVLEIALWTIALPTALAAVLQRVLRLRTPQAAAIQ